MKRSGVWMPANMLLLLAVTVLLGACSGMSLGDTTASGKKVSKLTIEELQQVEEHKIAPEDELEVVVWGVPEFESSGLNASGIRQAGFTYRVHADGSIDLPLIGNIVIGGLTAEEAKSRIADRMLHFVTDPKVSVTVTKYNSRKILVLGEVARPGLVLDPGPALSLAEALAQAGGVEAMTADAKHVYIIRGALEQPRITHIPVDTAVGMFQAQHIWLRSRDVVFVDSKLITDWNRFISQLLPTVTNAFLVQRMTQ